jgi:prepilin-type N-terminal cleavage/methylation domain-containing protein
VKKPHSATPRNATTLVELMVAMAILAIMAAVVGVAIHGSNRDVADTAVDRAAVARQRAIASGEPVVFTLTSGEASRRATALPDGSVVGASLAHIDRMTGRPSNASR